MHTHMQVTSIHTCNSHVLSINVHVYQPSKSKASHQWKARCPFVFYLFFFIDFWQTLITDSILCPPIQKLGIRIIQPLPFLFILFFLKKQEEMINGWALRIYCLENILPFFRVSSCSEIEEYTACRKIILIFQLLLQLLTHFPGRRRKGKLVFFQKEDFHFPHQWNCKIPLSQKWELTKFSRYSNVH